MLPALPSIWGLAACTSGVVVLDGQALVDPVDSETTAPAAHAAFRGVTTAAGTLPRVEGAFLAQEGQVEAVRDRCIAPVHALAGAGGQTLVLTLVHWDHPQPPTVEVVDLLGRPVLEQRVMEPLDSVRVTLGATGEHFVRLEPADPQAPAHAYGLDLGCFEGCDLEYTRYPVLLMHGAGGTDAYLDVLTYFYDIPETLAERGYASANPAVDGVAGIAGRSDQWMDHIDALVAEGLGRRFNLIGHSQGGLDARLVASALGSDRVVSVTTVSTPHHGTPVADVALGLYEVAGVDTATVDAVLTELMGWLGLGDAAAEDQLADLTTEALAAFNQDVPDVAGVIYTSWAGHSCSLLDWDCQASWGGEIVTPFLGTSFWLNALLAGDNDGMVPVESAVWGDFRGEFPADHFDEVGQIAGIVEAFDHRAFYLDEARRLAAEGL